MAQKGKKKDSGSMPLTGMERLALRVSSMINHPIAQHQRWVVIHRLDTDGDREWEELLGLLSETDGIEMTINDDDESITLRWEEASDEDRPVDINDVEVAGEAPPF
ncbi:DUF1654 domain-containing protein [Pseudomonas typographi]|uniref:DUF1654 domain-containing protein n=1 Tax=Pseudomonas typographi TaxID=2715964 RepID=A0ABR7ZA83_9PSED|nr:DUF1654 domain-containing protein [Pseudomonas typographi]MBD1602283.1 DUF1654 domain-containing protein [Pseudomonas typographi]